MNRFGSVAVAAIFIGALVQSAGAAGTRIGYVDLQRALVRSVAGVAAREQLEREKVTMQKEVERRKAELDKLKEEIERKGALLSSEARREKEESFERNVRDYRRQAEDFDKELQRKEQQASQQIVHELVGVVERIGKERGFLLIVERRGAGLAYGDPEDDLTEDVIKLYDQEKAKGRK